MRTAWRLFASAGTIDFYGIYAIIIQGNIPLKSLAGGVRKMGSSLIRNMHCKEQWNVSPEVKGLHAGVYGNFRGITGDVSRLRGDISKVKGNATGKSGDIHPMLRGDFSGITGDVTSTWGDATAKTGDVTDINDDITKLTGNVQSYKNALMMAVRFIWRKRKVPQKPTSPKRAS